MEAAQRPTMHFLLAVKGEAQQAQGMFFHSRGPGAGAPARADSAAQGPDRAAGRSAGRRGLRSSGGGRRVGQAAARADRTGSMPKDRRTRTGRSGRASAGVRRDGAPDGDPVNRPVTALALQAFAPSMESLRRGRRFLGLVGARTRQHTTGGKPSLGSTSKMGQRDLKRLLVTGTTAVGRHANWARRKPRIHGWPGCWRARRRRWSRRRSLTGRRGRVSRAVDQTRGRHQQHRDRYKQADGSNQAVADPHSVSGP